MIRWFFTKKSKTQSLTFYNSKYIQLLRFFVTNFGKWVKDHEVVKHLNSPPAGENEAKPTGGKYMEYSYN